MNISQALPIQVESIKLLLMENNLPLDGFPEDSAFIICAAEDEHLAGAAALEIHETFGLLRSVVVAQDCRGTGLGLALTSRVLEEAAKRDLKAVYLLTETAAGFFGKQGFDPVAREEVPEAVRGSVEFTTACPQSAQAMRYKVESAE